MTSSKIVDAATEPGWRARFAEGGGVTSGDALQRQLTHFGSYGRFGLLLVVAGDEITGGCSVCVNERVAPDEQHGPVGYLGHIRLPEGHEERVLLRDAALGWLRAQGAGVVRAPVDLSTWYANRLITEDPDGDPPFLTEPPASPGVLSWLREGSFCGCWSYVSAMVDDIRSPYLGWARWVERFEQGGGRLRPLDPGSMERELQLLHRLSQQAFCGNFSFSGIDIPEFADLYGPLLPLIDPQLVLFALDSGGDELGFCFNLPDPRRPEVLLVKSLGVLPSARGSGAGTALVDGAHRRGAARGCRSAIHVLMNQASASRNISAHGGRIFRRYSLLSRSL